MPRSTPLVRRLLMSLLAAAALTLGVTATATAHSELVGGTPADGDSFSEIPDEIVLEFNEDIEPIGNEVVVLGPSGDTVSDGAATVDGPTVTQPVGFDGAGDYTVTWRVVSADGHPISGEFSYELRVPTTVDPSSEETETAETTTEPPTTDATTDPATTEATTDDATTSGEATEDTGRGAAPWILGAGAVALVVATVLVIRRVRSR